MSRVLAWALVLLAALWCGGFAGFVRTLEQAPEAHIAADLPATDAIVVLTGGSERLTTGIELLESNVSDHLFISGVHRGLSLDGLLGAQPVPQHLRDCCIELGYQAGSTVGNAVETAAWMQRHGYRSLRLVTANYHMPRSLLLFHAVMPEVAIRPYPISPASVHLQEWWRHPNTGELLAVEYSKYLYANLRLSLADGFANATTFIQGLTR